MMTFAPSMRGLKEAFLLALLLSTWAILFFTIARSPVGPALWVEFPVQSLLTIQLLMTFHDCLHGSLFKSRRANLWAGRAIGSLYFWPFHFLRDSHLRHHRNAGLVENDPEVLHFNPHMASMNPAAAFLNRLAQTPLAPFLFTPILQAIHFRTWMRDARNDRKAVLRDGLVMVVVWFPVTAWLRSNGIFTRGFLLGMFLPGLLAMAVVYLAAKPLHSHMLATPMAERGPRDRALLISRTFDSHPFVRLLLCNLNYHIEHHLYPSVSRWELGRLAKQIRPEILAHARERDISPMIHKSFLKWTWEFSRSGPADNSIDTVERLRIENLRYLHV